MAQDFLEQLADLELREPPAEFDRELHQRVNRSLTVQQLLDLVLGALPWAIIHLAGGLMGVVAFSTTGRFDDERKADRQKPP